MVGPSRFSLEEVLVDWDKKEMEFQAGSAKGVAKDKEQTSGWGENFSFGVSPPFARAVVPPGVTENPSAGGA
jgi:hypothetical protein